MDLLKYDDKLKRRQIAYNEGLHLLQMTRSELIKDISGADGWGLVAVLSNATLVPLNIIVNTFLPFTPTSKLQKVIKFVYDKKAGSGTRGQTSDAKEAIKIAGSVGKEAVDYLAKGGLGEYIPGVRILVGLAQDFHRAD